MATSQEQAPSLLTSSGREFLFTTADFERVRKLIYNHAGISLTLAKQDMVYSRLARRLRETGIKTFNEYISLVEGGNKAEWEKFVNSLTTNLTSFFREPHHFPILAEFLKKNKNKSSIRIWCSAASTGEEPYSLAMTACEAFNSFSPPVSIIASDLDTQVLATASKGIYGKDRLDKMTIERMNRFFVQSANNTSEYEVRAELKRMITFQRLNLLEPNWAVRAPIDVIFCRNVMIYFDKPTQYKILSRFAPLLTEEGLLFAGHSESFLHAADFFQSLGKTVYGLTTKNKT